MVEVAATVLGVACVCVYVRACVHACVGVFSLDKGGWADWASARRHKHVNACDEFAFVVEVAITMLGVACVDAGVCV